MAKTNDLKSLEGITTVLGKKTRFSGTMRYESSLKIDGSFQGKIISPGYLYIEEGAVINADIEVSSVVIGGYVKGNVEAREKLELLPSGKLYGNVRTAKLKIADGVVFEGKCEMIKDGEEIDIFSDTGAEIKSRVKSV